MREIRIVLADASEAICQGMHLLLDLEPGFRVVATAGDGTAAIAAIARHRPDVALLDRELSGLDGLAATRLLAARHPSVAVILMATFGADADLDAARAAGACGYLLKGIEGDDLLRAVRAAADGMSAFPNIAQRRETRSGVRPFPE